MKKRLLFGFFFIIICFLFLLSEIYFPKNPLSEKKIIFIVEKGHGSREIALNLEKEGLIKSDLIFRAYVLLNKVAGKLQAGRYLLSPSMNIPEIVKKFVSGEIVKEKITIPEGFTLKQIEEKLSQKLQRPVLCQFLVKDFKSEFDFLEDAPDEANLEGFLFPDTYYFSLDTNDKEICQKILVNFEKKFALYRNEISGAGKTIFEIVTAASMIEKEVKTPEDKKLVSGILWKRLKYNIPLQVDATITYITGKKTTKISKEETQIDSPYNTYKYLGLPIGPICNPGLESILAALYPKDSEYWYYLSTPEEKTIFSKTLEEHNIAKAKYLK